jgi:hypothetical protein
MLSSEFKSADVANGQLAVIDDLLSPTLVNSRSPSRRRAGIEQGMERNCPIPSFLQENPLTERNQRYGT